MVLFQDEVRTIMIIKGWGRSDNVPCHSHKKETIEIMKLDNVPKLKIALISEDLGYNRGFKIALMYLYVYMIIL